MQKLLPLTEQVRGALREDRTSDQVKALIEELQHEVERIRTDLTAAKAKAVDPIISDAEADAARRLHHDLGFEEERATASVTRLKLKLREVEEAERKERVRVLYEAALKERDLCAALIRDEYPKHADAIVKILKRVMACNEQIKAAGRPEGAEWLQPPDRLVREADDVKFGQLIDKVVLPGMHRDAPLKWFRRVAEHR